MLALLTFTAALCAPSAAASEAPVTLAALQAHADVHAPAVALAAVDAARAEAEQRAADPWAPADPEIELGAGLRRRGGDSGLDFEVRLSQPIEVSGGRGLRREAARAQGETAAATLAAVRWRVRGEVEAAVVDIWLAQARIEWAVRAATLADRLAETARQRADAGAAPGADVILAEVQQRSAGAMLLDARQREIALRARLAARIDWPTATVPPITPDLSPLGPPEPIETLLARLAHHPRLTAADRRITAARARVSATERTGWPDPTVGIGFAREAGVAGEPDADIWSAGIGLPLPLWRGADAEIAHARVDVRHAEAARAALAAELRAGLVEAHADVERAAARAQALAAALAPLQTHAERVDAAYARGEVDLMTCLQIRTARMDAEEAALGAQAEYHRARVRLTRRAGPRPTDREDGEAPR